MVAHEILITNAMKMKFTLLTLVVAMLSSVSLFAQDQRSSSDYAYDHYEGQCPGTESCRNGKHYPRAPQAASPDRDRRY